ncbi:DUF72 domain-containing protein [Sphingomonas sp. CGMCC 1.13654]|uniref:DUF72 domain-containing protein n=1 Tax=Sphingomonas chungangi TaxID=2683589 RepID=A0A838L6J5_9SPHN|nr:DUF72 domain-containing protein [Sphingomonas chungangi]MBA2934667.1 DUF72 domain-containing protein [Sphingomonas chungangi]MVW57978.1 DUF72 domain-containing protein [Sphingomonas chungangi]
MTRIGQIRIGIGGWVFEPWRGSFYPEKHPKSRELEYAASKLTAIEINSTYYSSQKPQTFAGWAKAAPEGFKFSLKASRFATNRRVLAEAGESVERFLGQGITELGDKLGPIVWQFATTKKFDGDDFGAFLKLLPATRDGLPFRHVVDVRHESFRDPAFVALCRARNVSIVHTHSDEYPQIGDASGPVSYARLMMTREEEATGYAVGEIDRWAEVAKEWANGETGSAFPLVAPEEVLPTTSREVFLFYISGAKVRAPHAAMATIARL